MRDTYVLVCPLLVERVLVGLASPETAFVISAGYAMAHLAIGAMLHTKSGSTDGAEPSSDGDREVLTHD